MLTSTTKTATAGRAADIAAQREVFVPLARSEFGNLSLPSDFALTFTQWSVFRLTRFNKHAGGTQDHGDKYLRFTKAYSMDKGEFSTWNKRNIGVGIAYESGRPVICQGVTTQGGDCLKVSKDDKRQTFYKPFKLLDSDVVGLNELNVDHQVH